MKAIIPCAGRGTRLRPLTFTNSKPIIRIANKPLVVYALEKLKRVGVTEIGIVVSDNTQDMKDVLKDGSQYGVKLTYINQDKPKGIAHTIKVSQDFLGDDDFIMYLGDNLLEEGLEGAVERFNNNKTNAVMCVYPTEKPQLYGIVVLENDKVVRLVEKPKDPPSNLAAVGIYVFDKSVHQIVDNLQPSARGELEITDTLQGLIDQGSSVEHYVLQGWWIDAGNPDDMIEANRLVLQDIESECKGTVDEETQMRGNIIIGEGSVIEKSTLRGPIIIGKNCKIKNAFIGSFTSIGDDSHIENCEVEYSVLMENCDISNVEERIGYSIFGRHVTITSRKRRPKSYKLVLSDESAVELL